MSSDIIPPADTDFTVQLRPRIDEHLQARLDTLADSEIVRLARYITANGGHRWRPLVLIAAGTAIEPDSEHILMPAACALELVHSTTLMLDDLPSMDNARLRRGKPCAHLVFPPWAVDMAGPFLVNMAYSMILGIVQVPESCRVAAALDLSKTAENLCEGQIKDLLQLSPARQLSDIIDCYHLKTGSLYGAAARIGGILSGGDERIVTALSHCGIKLGLSVQCFDDVADVVSGVEVSGKHPGNDRNKRTLVDCLGIDKTIAMGKDFQQDALDELTRIPLDCTRLQKLIHRIPSAIIPE